MVMADIRIPALLRLVAESMPGFFVEVDRLSENEPQSELNFALTTASDAIDADGAGD
jgi:hypothetical protein